MKPLRILIVDDQPINRRLLTAQLESEGHSVLQAEHGVEALHVLDTAPVDVIVSDILMPVMDGYRLCGHARASDKFRELPFIFYTATYTSPADEEFCLQLGANRYLRKPVPIEEMLAAIEESLGARARAPAITIESEEILKEYSERLVVKLEQKNIELAAASDRLTLQAAALNAAADAILITDAQGTISWVNEAFSSIVGIAAGDAIGKRVGELDLGIPTEVFTSAYWQTRDESAWRGAVVRRRADGRVHHDEITITPVTGQKDGIDHFVGVMHDVTEREQAEERLRDAHEQLRELLDHSPAILYALKVEGETLVPRLFSDNLLRILGAHPSEITSFDWWPDHLHPDDLERAQAGMDESLATGSSRTEYRLRHIDGTYRWMDDTRRLILDAAGRPLELVGAATDVTELRAAQDELRESERRFQSMLANLELIAITVDREARITYCNDYFVRLTGWTREELLGRDSLETFIPPEILAEMRRTFEQLLADLPEASHHQNEIVTRSGKRRLIQWNNTVLRSRSGEVIGTASIGEDVTERRNLEQQMLRAQRLESLGTLAGGIAHDLNNLLMPILMGANLLKRRVTDERGKKAIDSIETSVKRGGDLVKQVLLFARGAETSRNAVQLASVVSEVEAIATSTFPKNIRLEFSIPRDLRPVTGDMTQLTQVLLNLLVNARDAMPRGGQIAVRAENTELSQQTAQLNGGTAGAAYVTLEVSDTGEGIPREIVERIFDPFFTTKEVGMGTGLGLSTVQGIVVNHGGFVSVDSIVGEGTTFRVHLPAREQEGAPQPAEEEAATELPHGNGEVVLVVDDDTTVLSITTQALEAFGYTVVGAEDGAQALGVYSHRSDIALVLTDMSMPVIDGEALIAALTRIDPRLPIIAATGNTAAAHLAKITRSGAAAVLTKPYSAEQLLRSVAEALAKASEA